MSEHYAKRLSVSYESLLKRLKQYWETHEDQSAAQLRRHIDQTVAELKTEKRLSEHEACDIQAHLHHDLEDWSLQQVAHDHSLKDEIKFDLTYLEATILDRLAQVADPTKLALMQRRQRFENADGGDGGGE